MDLFSTIPSPFRMFDKFCRDSDTQPSVHWDIVYIHPRGRPSHFPSCVFSGVEISAVRLRLDFCCWYALVVLAWSVRGIPVHQIHSTERASWAIDRMSGIQMPTQLAITAVLAAILSFVVPVSVDRREYAKVVVANYTNPNSANEAALKLERSKNQRIALGIHIVVAGVLFVLMNAGCLAVRRRSVSPD
jgi:hypothetical protein